MNIVRPYEINESGQPLQILSDRESVLFKGKNWNDILDNLQSMGISDLLEGTVIIYRFERTSIYFQINRAYMVKELRMTPCFYAIPGSMIDAWDHRYSTKGHIPIDRCCLPTEKEYLEYKKMRTV